VARPTTLHGLLEIISLHFSIVLSVSMKFSPGGGATRVAFSESKMAAKIFENVLYLTFNYKG